jgi:type III pantothenate kinase
MKLLVVDIGNTDIKFGIFQDGLLTQVWRASGTRAHPERFSAMLRESLAKVGAEFGALVYSSVVPDVEMVFRKTIQYCFNLPEHRIFAISPDQIRLPLDFNLYPSGQLGMDRLVNACGARFLYPGSHLIVVDFGTATTFDLVDASGTYRGGAIAPGLVTFCDSLSEKTARLPKISLSGKQPEQIRIGTNTVACMEAGLGMGYRGLMKELLRACAMELGTGAFQVIATGGLAESVIQLCGLQSRFHKIDPALTLQGLYHLFEWNNTPVVSP